MARTRSSLLWLAAALFVVSGFSALAFQTVLNKYFSLIFGVSAYAAATVLAAFMFGLAAGSYLLGRLASERLRKHLLWYGALEGLIGLYALGFIRIAEAVEHFYTPLARDLHLSPASLTLVRFAAAFALVGVPTTLMGGSLPLLVEALRRRGSSTSVNVLYALNVVGAAAGTVASAYVLLPAVGLQGTLRLVCSANFGVAVMATVAGLVWRREEAPRGPSEQTAAATRSRLPPRIAGLAFASGFLTFCNEVFWYHLLGLVVGTSVYAYSIMLFTTLVGMAVGGLIAQQVLARGVSVERLLVGSLLGVAAATLVTLPFWDKVPQLFGAFEMVATSFATREVVRFLASCLLIFPAALFAGLTFPALLFATERDSRDVGADIGRLTAVNTVGTIAGSLAAGFVLLALLGGRHALLFTAGASVAAVVLVPGLPRRRTLALLGAGLAGWAATAALLPGWDPRKLLSGTNIYFAQAHDAFDEVLWQHEDYVGGVTSVVRSGTTRTLLTNGKFQGNDASEVRDQRRFALIPNLFVARPERALNIGVGTGTTLAVIHRFPYKELDAVELSPDILEAARSYFGGVNANVLDQQNVKVHVEDGRSFLATRPAGQPYDLISIELTSIWFAGAGNLYNDEFYELAKRNLSRDGVLQQWIQLHHVSETDVAVIIGTLRKHFRYVQLWLPSHQGILVASDSPLRPSPARVDDLMSRFDPADFFLGDPRTVFGELLLDSDQVDAFLAEAGAGQPLPLSTDGNLYLELSTPKGNALGWNYDSNFLALYKHSEPAPERLLEPVLAAHPELVSYARLGRAGFFPRESPEWHQAMEAALDGEADAEARAALKARVLRTLLDGRLASAQQPAAPSP